MNKKIILSICIIAVIALSLVLGYFLLKEKDTEETRIATANELKFKKEYEADNGTQNKDGKNYPVLAISDLNGAKYVTEMEAVDIIKGGTGILYFGFPLCPWCRSTLPVFLNALENNGVEEFYYLNILDIRDTKELDSKNKVITTKEGTNGYYKLLEALDSVLDEYTLKNSKGKTFKTGIKRLYAPTMVFVRDGEIQGIHVGTVDSQEDPYVALSTVQKEELSTIYNDLIKKVINSTCEDDKGC